MASRIHVAVTGLNAGVSPAPGVGVVRCLKESGSWNGRVIGLSYDAFDSGVLDRNLTDCSYILPYPKAGRDALLERLTQIHERERIDVIIPCLDAEIPNFIALEPLLSKMGIRLYLPSADQFKRREKPNLPQFSQVSGIPVPETMEVNDPHDPRLQGLRFPVMVKGLFYDAYLAHSALEAAQIISKIASEWGYPVLVQRHIQGDEFNVVALGDGEGAVVGSACMKKVVLTEKGKGWACVSIENSKLSQFAESIVSQLSWRGPLEVEAIFSDEDQCFYLIEVNPRFPAWVYLAKAAGADLPTACLELALGKTISKRLRHRAGVIFSNYTINLVAELDEIKTLFTTGELQNEQTL